MLFSVFAGPYDADLAAKIDAYLAAKNSPLAGYGAAFVSSGVFYNVDPRLIVAIAGAESSFALDWAACSPSGFNAWSWFYNGSCPASPFTSYAEGVSKVTSGLRRIYLSKGYTTIPLIASKYCASGCEGWIPNVTRFYTDLGGDSNDLTYETPSVITLQPGPTDGKDIWTTSIFSYAMCSGSFPGGGLNDETLRVGGWGDLYYSLLQFNLAGQPANVHSAVLQLYCLNQSGGGTPMYLDRITGFWDWRTQGTGCDRLRLWWTDRPAATQWVPNQITNAIVGQWYAVDITDLYNAWQNGTYPNYGLQLRPANSFNNNFNDFYSSDYVGDPSLRPKLVITP